MTSVDIEQIVLENLDFEIVCKPHNGECERKAEWLFVKNCCGAEYQLCTPCKDETVRFLLVESMRGNIITCVLCGVVTETLEHGRWIRL
jgi:hypothetical protein